ncbi:hypothetical protein CPB86DRAFT_822713 [Serendipita vermifera]|nr:hypothetical protein CPB86DRAFT_822713 [Serendipita vermifera]
MYRWLLGATLVFLSAIEASAPNASEPFSVEWSFAAAECEWLEFWFYGGVAPYSLYYAVTHASNNISWSQEALIASTSNVVFNLQLSPDIGTEISSEGSDDCNPRGVSTRTLQPSTTTKEAIVYSGHTSMAVTEDADQTTGETLDGQSTITTRGSGPLESANEEGQISGSPQDSRAVSVTDIHGQSLPLETIQITEVQDGITIVTQIITPMATPVAASTSRLANGRVPVPDDNTSASSSENKPVHLLHQAAGVIGGTIAIVLVLGTEELFYLKNERQFVHDDSHGIASMELPT